MITPAIAYQMARMHIGFARDARLTIRQAIVCARYWRDQAKRAREIDQCPPTARSVYR